MVYAGVRILDVPAKADREFDYAVPEEFAPEIKAGNFVKVPLREDGNAPDLSRVCRTGLRKACLPPA